MLRSGMSANAAHGAAWSEKKVTDVQLHYLPWDDYIRGFWCTRITVRSGAAVAELLLGGDGRDGQLSPAADNVAVLFDPPQLPEWEPTAH